MKLAIKIAKKFLLSNKSQSVLIISAIAIGISVQLFIGLLIQGLQSDLINSTIGDASHISVSQSEDFIYDEEVITELENTDGIISVSPVLLSNSFMEIDDENYSIILNGIDLDNNIYSLDEKLSEGSLPKADDEIMLGVFYDVEIGEEVTFILADGKSTEFKVVGKFDFGNSTVNEKSAYLPLSALQTFTDNENKISVIETQVDEVFLSDEIAKEIDLDEYEVTTWQEANASLLSALSSQSMSSIIIQVFIIISVTLAISSVLIISVVQKSKQIGILKAMGLNDRNISRVFVTQGFMLGAIGSTLGIILGLLLSYSFTTFAVDETGNAVINIYFSIDFIAISFFIGVGVSTIASLIPARKSRKLSAMEVIGNG